MPPNLFTSLLLILSLWFPPTSPSLIPNPDAAALLAFKSGADSGGKLRFNRSSPCLWSGVACSLTTGRVLRLVLESSALDGSLAPLARLSDLRVLSLKSNSLSGPIPTLPPNLKALFLSRNLLSGPFPPSLLSLRRLRTLDLSHNLLSGPIPPYLASLPSIHTLLLASNQFTGPLPPLNQSSLKSLDVSANDLSGPVPLTAPLLALDPSAFAGNPRLCGEVLGRVCRPHFPFFPISPSPAISSASLQLSNLLVPPSETKHKKRVLVALGFLAGAFLVMGMVGISVAVRKKRSVLNSDKDVSASGPVVESINDDIEAGNEEELLASMVSEEKMKRMGRSGCLVFCAGEAPVYSLEQLMRGSAEMMGRGSLGTTYKAVLDNRLIVCVKRLDATKMGSTGKEAFDRHMDAVGRLRHPNLVPLRAYFQAKEERLLVYDYQPNGSLFSLIHGSRSTRAKPLHWTSCLKIAEDIAQGLAYIHQASSLVHSNIKSSNVLLGSDFEACLTDNCLSLLSEPSDGEDDSGYRAPETRKSNRRLTPRSDVYAFGVLLLELLTGKPPLQHPTLVATDLSVWVRSVREDEGTEDERLTMIIDIAAACVRSSPESRPTTWQVLKMIQEVKEVDTGDNEDDSLCIS